MINLFQLLTLIISNNLLEENSNVFFSLNLS